MIASATWSLSWQSRVRTFASLRIEHANYKHNYAQEAWARATCWRIEFTHHYTQPCAYTNARKNVRARKQLSARRLDACWPSVVSSIRFLVNFSFYLEESCASAVTVQSKKQYPASIEPLIMPSFVSSRWMSCRRMRMKYFHFHDWTDDEELAAAACTAATDGDSWFPACSMRNGSKDREKPDMPLKR